MVRYVIATDYDRTITDESLNLCTPLVNMIESLKIEHHVKFIVCSGRRMSFLHKTLPGTADGIIAENGAIIEYENQRVLLNESEGKRIRAVLEGLGLPILFGEVIAYVPNQFEKQTIDAIKDRDLNWSIERNRNSIMVLPRGVNKGQGLKRLLELAELKNAYTIAFGDAENDLSLLNVADMSIAVANADQSLKAIAKVITQKPFCEGVMDFLKEFFDSQPGAPGQHAQTNF
ncbi:MAG: HAD family phosphatase [Nitrososphaerota archaeon]|jgi:phosphoglycolate phosphatase (TIGR01487 family)|nr:HAD family phosphatase [Nitrososphaerota archaeon]MDG7036187.1 HAD family phosphatase [Nitrososphaerota archaeon]MDG7039624.1 HAD family phosphatase [Nitrososphaerota archaeon]MDG7040220.1 HAD family phosphatase [Nitrososphaerota archaeon]MDG7041669.1 HAD family phosphatase [Nitrososphaerota archaeon]